MRKRKMRQPESDIEEICSSGQFQEHYVCTFCGYKALRQAKSPFFHRHWGCTEEDHYSAGGRRFLNRPGHLQVERTLPPPEALFCAQWYHARGDLPPNLRQPLAGGMLQCTVCAAMAVQGNVKRFTSVRMQCLRRAVVWNGDGTYWLDQSRLFENTNEVVHAEQGC
eukprot:505245-Amphidinium_carterae.1